MRGVLNTPAAWRIPPSWNERSPWASAPHDRPLRLVLDYATTASRPAVSLLQTFIGYRGLEIYSTDSSSTWRVEVGEQPNANNALLIRYVSPQGDSVAGLFAGDDIPRYASALACDTNIDEQAARRLLRLKQAALHHNLDAIVTDLNLPTERTRARPGLPADLASAELASWLVGLYLRAHNDFTVEIGNVTHSLDSEDYYHGVALAAIDGDRWLHEADRLYRAGNAIAARLLAGATTRLARALRLRDHYAVCIRHWRPDETWAESLAFFEAVLLFLGGALDAIARFVAVQTGTKPPSNSNPSFRNRRWIARLLETAPGLEPQLGESGALRAAGDAVAAIRNLIHERAPSEMLELFFDGRPLIIDHRPGVIVLDGPDARRLQDAIERLGASAAEWGVERADEHAVRILPFVFMPSIVPAIMKSLAGLIQALVPALPDTSVYIRPNALNHASTLLLLSGLASSQHVRPSATSRLLG
jgi:hypothetical protein